MDDLKRWRRLGPVALGAAAVLSMPVVVTAWSGSVSSGPVMSGPDSSGSVLSGPVSSDPAGSTHAQPGGREAVVTRTVSVDECRHASRKAPPPKPPDDATQGPGQAGEVGAWARHPADGRMYAVSELGSLVRWDPDARRYDSGFPDTVVPQSAYADVVFDTAGNLYVAESAGSSGEADNAANPGEDPGKGLAARVVYQLDLRQSTAQRPVALESVRWGRPLGDVETTTCMPAADYGDAPGGYGTTAAQNGPAHQSGPRLALGKQSTIEPDAPRPIAKGSAGEFDGEGDTGDDAFDALQPVEPYTQRYTLEVPYRSDLPKPVTLAGWLDADLSGTFDPDERQVVIRPPGDGRTTLRWPLPEIRPSGTSYVRLRLYEGRVADPAPTGAVDGPGEVEDHPIVVRSSPFSDAGVKALPAEAYPGGQGILPLIVRNFGPYDADVDVVVAVTPPGHVTFRRLPSNCTERRRAVTCRVPADRLPAGEDAVALQLPFAVASNAPAKVTLAGGSVRLDKPRDPSEANNSTDLSITTLPGISDLSARLVNAPYHGVPGQAAQVTVEVGNAGPSDTGREAELVLDLPGANSAAGRLPGGCAVVGRQVRCSVPAGIAAGGMRRLQIPVTLPSDLPAGAVLTGGGVEFSLASDPRATNNRAGFLVGTDIPISEVSVTTVPKGASQVPPGKSFRYAVRVANRGPSDALDVRVRQDLPVTLTLADGTPEGCTTSGRRLDCTAASVPAGSAVEYEMTATLTPAYTGDGTDTGDVVTVSSRSRDRDRGNNAGRTRLPAGVADPEVDIAVSVTTEGGKVTPGASNVLAVTAKNLGPSQTDGKARHVLALPDGVTAAVSLPDGCSADGDSRIACRIPAGMWPGTSLRWEIPIQTGPEPPPGGAFGGGRVEAHVPMDPVAGNNRTEFAIKSGKSLADLVMTKRPAARRSVSPGGVFDYELLVTNSGPSDAANVVVRDRLPEEFTYVGSDDGCRVDGRQLVCPVVKTLRRGEYESFHARMKLDPCYRGNGAELAGTAVVSSDTTDPDASNNTSEPKTSGVPGGVVVHPPADLAVTLTPEHPVRERALVPGDTVEYEVKARNTGPFEALHLDLHGILPAPMTLVSASDGCTATEAGFSCPPVESFGAGEVVKRRLVLRLDPLYAGDGSDLVLQVKVQSYAIDPDPTDNTITWYPMRSTA